MWTTIARIILRQKVLLLILLGLAVGFMGYQASRIGISYEFFRILPVDDPAQIDFMNFQKEFGDVSNSVVLANDNPDLFSPRELKLWKELGDSLLTIDGVTNVLSITNAPDLVLNDSTQKLQAVPFMDRLPTTPEEARALQKKFQERPLYKGLLVSEDDSLHLMMLSIKEEYLYNQNIIRIIEDIKSVVSYFETQSQEEIYVSGLPYVRMANTTKLKKEVRVLILLTILVTTAILFFFLKSARATAVSLVVVVIGVIFTFGLISTYGYRINLITSLVAPLVIVIGIPNCIFLINKYHAEFRKHGNKILALQRVIRRIGGVTFLTNFTTALGFAAFILTDSTSLIEFGVVASTNILVVFIVSLVVIPIMYSYLPEPIERHYKHLDKKWLNSMIRFLIEAVTHHRIAIYVVTGILIILGFIGLYKIETTGNLTNDFAHNDPVLLDLKKIEKHFNGVVPLEILIDTKEPNGVQNLSFLKKIDGLQRDLDTISELSRSLSIVDFLKASRQAFYFNDPSYFDLPNRQDRDWVLAALPDPGSQATNTQNLVDSTRSVARIMIQVSDIGTPEMKVLRDEVEEIVHKHFDPEEYNVTLTGASVIFLKGTTYLIKNLIISLSLAIFVISLIMAFLFGSARMVMISLLPNLIPLLLTAAIMGFFHIPLKPSTILVFSIAFGISVDDTIHFLAKYRQELKTNGWRIGKAVVASIQETGVSMFYTSVVLFFGFSIFVWSEFGGSVSLGILVSITLLFAMFSNLLILPALLMSLEKFISAREFSEDIIEYYEGEEEEEDQDPVKPV
ncbi:MAG: efflux RND transporter permease subunit [Bacteroidota bacterium]|nr:efflux RND transporter permease subunit [Bacteroidota bacterium]MDX5427631.1 efflux RND transporter permease subunit [Bacteroidota bacterium]MDX5505539.1 efflux RND transporter permease subunit [Bacteroidota bacterium]